MNKNVSVAQARCMYEIIADGKVLREILIWRVRRHHAQVVLIL